MSANQDEPATRRQEQHPSPSLDPQTSSQRTTVALVAFALVVGIALRTVAFHQFQSTSLWGDEADYLTRAIRLARTGGLEGIDRAPGYIAFLAAAAKWSSAPVAAARWAQIFLGALSTLLLFFLARASVGTRTAIAAAWIFALYPTLIGFSQLLFLETLYICVLLAAALALTRAWETRSSMAALLAGLLLGASALVKSLSLILVPVFAACWFLREKPRSAAWRVVLFAASFALVILPYAWRNHVRYGGWVLIDTSASRTLWHANHIEYRPGYDWGIANLEDHYDGSELPETGSDPVRDHQELLRRELGFLLEHPGLIASRIPEKIGAFWNPTSFVQRSLARDAIPQIPRESVGTLVASLLISASYAAVLFLGIVGLLAARPSPLRTCFLAMLATFLLVHSVMVCQSRYRLPLMPFFMIFAAQAVFGGSGRLTRGSWRTWTACALIAITLALWWPYLPFVLMQRFEAW